jgi:hypothetical protein
MLLRFAVENYRSMRERQELSLVASSLDDVSSGLIQSEAAEGSAVLPAVILYGANASGKSTLVSALRWMKTAIMNSHRRGEPGGSVPVAPFLLDDESAAKPSVFEADFVWEDVRYQYGFEATKDGFAVEWLYSYPNGRRQALFERRGMEFNFSRILKGQNKVIAGLTRSNSLFLSAAVQNGHEQLSRVSTFFSKMQFDSGQDSVAEMMSLADRKLDTRIIDFLGRIGTGIVDYRIDPLEKSERTSQVLNDLDALFKKHFDESFDLPETFGRRISLGHRGGNRQPVFMDFATESDGTQRLLFLLPRIFDVLNDGALLVVDELGASLHTQACEALLLLFSSKTNNLRAAQLIATTHDTNMLRLDIVRRDQVWFTEKDPAGASHLYPLTDIRTRKGDNIEKGYLQGRFGAVPFSGSADDFIEKL